MTKTIEFKTPSNSLFKLLDRLKSVFDTTAYTKTIERTVYDYFEKLDEIETLKKDNLVLKSENRRFDEIFSTIRRAKSAEQELNKILNK
jgi:hypothetical protein